MTKSGDEEEKIFESHNFTWEKHFLGTYQSENVTSRKRYLSRLSICFQLFHAQDKDFLYPFQIYNYDIINEYGSDVLMEHFNSWGISANPDTFRLFRSEVAQNQKDELLKGEIHNLEKEVFGVAHADKKEFLKKYKRQGDRIVYCTGTTPQQPIKTLVLPDTGDVTESNSNSIENDQKKLIKNKRFESSFKEIPEYVKPAPPHTTISKYAKPSAFQFTNKF